MTTPLSALLDPVPRTTFLACSRDRRHLHIPRNIPGFYHDVLTIRDVDRLLESEQVPVSFFDVVTAGSHHPAGDWSRTGSSGRGEERVAIPQRLLELYASGATLILIQSHRTLAGLSLTCRELAGELGCGTHANVYITPPGAQGFQRHSDEHDVLILQISGCKSWVLSPSDGSRIEAELRPGDLLFIPRGLAHEGITRASASIHVTVGLHPLYGFDLIAELARSAEGDPRFQQPWPFLPAADEERTRYAAEFTEHLKGLVAETRVSALAAVHLLRVAERQTRSWQGRFSDFTQLDSIKAETVVCRRQGVMIDKEDSGGALQVRLGTGNVSVPKFLDPCLQKILGETPFAVKELEGMITPEGKIQLVQSFVRLGLLQIVTL